MRISSKVEKRTSKDTQRANGCGNEVATWTEKMRWKRYRRTSWIYFTFKDKIKSRNIVSTLQTFTRFLSCANKNSEEEESLSCFLLFSL